MCVMPLAPRIGCTPGTVWSPALGINADSGAGAPRGRHSESQYCSMKKSVKSTANLIQDMAKKNAGDPQIVSMNEALGSRSCNRALNLITAYSSVGIRDWQYEGGPH
jgi:hypothetical protein